MRTFKFFRKNVFQMFLAAVAGAALVAGVDSIPGIAAPEEQLGLHPFVRSARSAERVDIILKEGIGTALERQIERYMWEDVYMMGEIYQIIEIPNDGGDDYLIRVSTDRHEHPTHDANIWLGGSIALVYWDAPPQFSVISEGDIVEFVATVIGFETATNVNDDIFTVPLLNVVAFQEMEYPGTAED